MGIKIRRYAGDPNWNTKRTNADTDTDCLRCLYQSSGKYAYTRQTETETETEEETKQETVKDSAAKR